MAKGFKYIDGEQGQILQEMFDSLNFFSRQVGFDFLFIPIVAEETVYQKVGEGSDLMTQKQIFYLEDQSRRKNTKAKLILRPEFTGGIMHYEKNHKIQGTKRYVSYGPVFRRENPQKGRLRGFLQYNLEIFAENNFAAVFDLLWPSLRFFEKFNLKVSYEFNYLPNQEYLEKLELYFKKNKDKLSKLSQLRLEKGAVLRIFDSKQPEDKIIIDQAPEITIPEDKLAFLQRIKSYVEQNGQKFVLNRKLVRGLDYYEHFVFEIINLDKNQESLGALGGGGCYSTIQGKNSVPALGMALGINRIIPLIKAEKSQFIRVGILSLNLFHLTPPENFAFLRIQEKSFEKSLKFAKQQNCEYIILEKAGKNLVRCMAKDSKTKDSNLIKLNNLLNNLN
jgi:histidyl-tRNA synthetase